MENADELKDKLLKIKQGKGPALLEIRCNKGARKNLGRPTQSTFENKKQFMGFLQNKP